MSLPSYDADVVIVGGGAAGTATAWWLARNGRSVLLLEQFGPGHTRGSSHGNSRIFRLAYPDPEYVGMARAALDCWKLLERESGRQLLRRVGGLDWGATRDPEGLHAVLASCGVASELLGADAARARFPGLAVDTAAVWQPDAGVTDADAAVAAMRELAVRHGAQLVFERRVERITVRDGDAAVHGDFDTLRAPVVVVTAGAWLEGLLGPLVTLPPLTVTQEQVFHFRPVVPDLPWPAFVHKGVRAMYGMPTTLDGVGPVVKVAEHQAGPVVTADLRSGLVDPAARERVSDYVRRTLPGLDPEPLGGLTCLYTSTPSSDFVLDRRGPLVVGSACSGHGFKFAPLLGQILGGLAIGTPAPGPRFRLPEGELAS